MTKQKRNIKNDNFLDNPAMKARLDESIDQVNKGETVEFSLEDLKEAED